MEWSENLHETAVFKKALKKHQSLALNPFVFRPLRGFGRLFCKRIKAAIFVYQ